MPTKDWYNNTLAHSPGVGAVFGLLSCSVLPWQVNVLSGCMLVVIGLLAYREWSRLNVVSFLRQQSSSCKATVLIPLFGLVIAGYYLTWLLGWWIRMESFGIAFTGVPFVIGGPVVSALTYRRAVRVFGT